MLNLDLLDDSQLLEAVIGHNKAAFAMLYQRYQQKVYATAYYLLRDESDAQDLLQEVFWTIWEKRADIKPDHPFQPYVLTITRHKSTNRLKSTKSLERNKYHYQYVKDSVDARLTSIELSELGKQIHAAIAEIPAPAARRAFELSYLENKSQKEIADEMNISLGTVKNQVSRALKIVREKLGNINK